MKIITLVTFIARWALINAVLNLGSNFKDIYKDGYWYIMFYAPWCGYCKQLEPVWEHIARILDKSTIHVGKIDGTIHSNLASLFNVHGYPTIILFAHGVPHVYDGKRTLNSLLVFADKIKGPPIRKIQNMNDFFTTLDVHQKGVFYLNIETINRELEDNYQKIALQLFTKTYFYSISMKNLPEQYHHIANELNGTHIIPSIFVFKDNRVYPFISNPYYYHPHNRDANINIEHENLHEHLYTWIRCERFKLLIEDIEGEHIQESHWCHKTCAIAYIKRDIKNNFIGDSLPLIHSLFDIASKGSSYSNYFWFGYTEDRELMTFIRSSNAKVPSLVVFDAVNFTWYDFMDDPFSDTHNSVKLLDNSDNFNPQSISLFLDRVLDRTQKVHGGNDMKHKIYRKIFGFYNSIQEMFRAQPFLSSVIFGLPTCIFTFLLYNVFCVWGDDDNQESNFQDLELDQEQDEEEENISNTPSSISRLSNNDMTYPSLNRGENLREDISSTESDTKSEILPCSDYYNITKLSPLENCLAIKSYSDQEWIDDVTYDEHPPKRPIFYNQSFINEKGGDEPLNSSLRRRKRRRLLRL